MRKSIKILALVGVLLGALAFAPAASAHEPAPIDDIGSAVPADLGGVCVVTGQVFTDPTPPPLWVAHGHYEFLSSVLECVGVTDANATDTINVKAEGNTDGINVSPWSGDGASDSAANRAACGADPASCLTTPAVEDGSSEPISWSGTGSQRGANDCGEAGAGHIEADGGRLDANGDPFLNDGTGYVKFIRLGPIVEAWGSFCTGQIAGVNFSSQLIFTPTQTDGVYLLNGLAELWR